MVTMAMSLGGGALRVGEVGLADLFADGDDDALPADHGSKAEGESDGDLDPGGDEPGGRVEELLVVGDDLVVGVGDLGRRPWAGGGGFRW